MNNKLNYTFKEDLKERLKDLEFKKAWDESEPEYILSCQLIKKRLKSKLSQRQLAKKTKTTQAVISRLETMNGNPSLSLLKRLSTALNQPITLTINPK